MWQDLKKILHASLASLRKWSNYGGPTPAKQSGLQTGEPAASCQVGGPDEVSEPCGPLRAWSQRKHTPRAASSARWMCLTMLTTSSPSLSSSLGHWASLATRWLCSPSTGGFVWGVWIFLFIDFYRFSVKSEHSEVLMWFPPWMRALRRCHND